MEKEKIREYMVTCTRFGFVNVNARSPEEAMEIANHQTTEAIDWSDDWEPTDVDIADEDPDTTEITAYMC